MQPPNSKNFQCVIFSKPQGLNFQYARIPGEVPIFNEGIKDKAFKKILKKNLRTGEFDMGAFLIEKVFQVPVFKSKNHHDNMNHDNGVKDGVIGKLAEETAAKHSQVIIESKKNDTVFGGEISGIEVKAKRK